MADTPKEYLTTKELAALLRIKERKVYDLAASGQIPCSRALGKLLFPRRAVEAWLNGTETKTGAARTARPNVFLGSHDPLLEWALRESQSGLAIFFDGSLDGIERFARREGLATGLHVFDPESGSWNVPLVRQRFADEPAVLVEWAWRERGLLLRPGLEQRISGLADLRGLTVVPRPEATGSQRLFTNLLQMHNLKPSDVAFAPASRSEADAALAVQEERADAAFGLACLARQYRLAFVPVARERFDLLVDRRAWFEPPMQRLLAFCRTPAFVERAGTLGGYDITGLGKVWFNGA